MQIMTREDVERVARIAGSESAAAQALVHAEAVSNPVFIRTPGGIAVAEATAEDGE